MSLSNLTVADLRQLEKLLSRKQRLQDEIAQIDRTLLKIERGFGANGVGRRRAGLAGRRGGGGRKGLLKAKIVSSLKAAGKQGMHVKDLASKLKVKEPNIRVWFYATGKKIKNIKQIKPATYRWED